MVDSELAIFEELSERAPSLTPEPDSVTTCREDPRYESALGDPERDVLWRFRDEASCSSAGWGRICGGGSEDVPRRRDSDGEETESIWLTLREAQGTRPDCDKDVEASIGPAWRQLQNINMCELGYGVEDGGVHGDVCENGALCTAGCAMPGHENVKRENL
jgi:hypothetical protein